MRILPSALTILICVFWATVAANAKNFQAQDCKTNQKWLENILDSTFTKVVDQNVLKNGEVIQIDVITTDSSFYSYQITYLRQKLLYGINAILPTGNSQEHIADKKLILRWMNWEISYTSIKERFWQKSKYLRNFSADCFVEVEDLNSKTIIFTERFRFEENDTISKTKLKNIQNVNLPFTMGNFIEKKGIVVGFLEPLFLFAISGTVVYLFYSIRSQ